MILCSASVPTLAVLLLWSVCPSDTLRPSLRPFIHLSSCHCPPNTLSHVQNNLGSFSLREYSNMPLTPGDRCRANYSSETGHGSGLGRPGNSSNVRSRIVEGVAHTTIVQRGSGGGDVADAAKILRE
jgi:hypothetical protein